MGDKERPEELASRSRRRRRGNEVEEPFSPKTRKMRPRRKRAMTVINFHISFVCLIYSIFDINTICVKIKLEMRRKKTTPRQDSTGVHVWLVFMKAFQALLPTQPGASNGQSWATRISASWKRFSIKARSR